MDLTDAEHHRRELADDLWRDPPRDPACQITEADRRWLMWTFDAWDTDAFIWAGGAHPEDILIDAGHGGDF